MSVARPPMVGPSPSPGDTAGSTTQSSSNTRVVPSGDGRTTAVAPAPDGIEMPPIGMSRPAERMSRVIRLSVLRRLRFTSDSSAAPSADCAIPWNAPIAMASVTEVMTPATSSSTRVKPASERTFRVPGSEFRVRVRVRCSMFGFLGERRDERFDGVGPFEAAGQVADGDAQAAKVGGDILQLDFAGVVRQRLLDVVVGAEVAVGARQGNRLDRLVLLVGGVEQAVGARRS